MLVEKVSNDFLVAGSESVIRSFVEKLGAFYEIGTSTVGLNHLFDGLK